jgi:hypothetical protein
MMLTSVTTGRRDECRGRDSGRVAAAKPEAERALGAEEAGVRLGEEDAGVRHGGEEAGAVSSLAGLVPW